MSETDSADFGADRYPDFAVVWSFFNKFGKQLELENVSIQDVSQWISTKCSESTLTVDVMVKLMRKTGMRVDKQRWQKFLLKATAKQDPQLAVEMGVNGFDALSPVKKLRIFKLLCEMQFDDNIRFKTQINNENPEEQRLKPVGKNEDGCLYWYQQDEKLNIRIYIEDQDDDDETGWRVACRTKDEIEELIKRLSNEPAAEKLDNSDNEDGDVVETKFQKFLKSQCNADSDSDDDVKNTSHDETKTNEKECNDGKSNAKFDNVNPSEHDVSHCCERSNLSGVAGSSGNSPNCAEADMKLNSVITAKSPEHEKKAGQVDKSVIKIDTGIVSCPHPDSSHDKSNECRDKPVLLDSEYAFNDGSDKPKTITESVPSNYVNESTIQAASPSSRTPLDNIDSKVVVKLENNINVAVTDKVEAPAIDIKPVNIVNGCDPENGFTNSLSSDHMHISKIERTANNVGAAEVIESKNIDNIYENQANFEGKSLNRDDTDCHGKCDAEATKTSGGEGNLSSTNIQGDTVKDGMESKSPSIPDSSEKVTSLDRNEDLRNFESEKDHEEIRNSDSEDHSTKEHNTAKRKKRRRRAPVSRRRSRPTKQNSQSKLTPRQQTKPKLSRIALLQKEAESIIQKEKDEKEAKDSSYRTRSGRRVKSTKHDQNESDVWQTIPDVIATTNDDVKDRDFHYTEGKPRSTTKSNVEVTPKKPRRSRKNDLPCEKCGLFSHPTTILLCDECNKGHHMACLTPPLMAVPEDDWFCPKCCKEKLIASLKEIFENLETKIKLNERKMRQTERNKVLKEYTGISATNIIAVKPKPTKPAKRKKSYSSNSEDELADSDSLSEPSSLELKSVRSCRSKKVTYDFSSFDKTIRDAIGEVDEPDSSDEKPISGKDIRTIVAAQKGEEAAKKFALEDAAAARRKKRNLTNLNYSEDEVVESGSNYSVSSSEGEVSEEEFMGSEDLDSDGSFRVGLRRSRRRNKRAEMKPIKRSQRLKRKRIQEDYESDLSDSSTEYEEDVPKKNKRRNRADKSSEDEYQPPRVKPRNFVDDDEEEEEEDNEGAEGKEEPKRSRVLHSSSEDEKKSETALPKKPDKSAAPKRDDEVSSDDWSSLSSNAEESFEDDLSTEEAVPKS